ncbi:MAM and LDL-receptor class A domain-containing protein 2 [Holothuria leucospilota]|uniref:MAM and LDL-receptor class A domain-containing protein 2 n=1 Tax=Holothuria leucospilota TaxID=206669 RepID=A0A9Q1CT88_HOLLE|nr:MAM and LDL-receptor class A domain-containing protein 2 [Holothuria leucospilota]
MYMESNSPRKMGDRARLGSPNFRASDDSCEMRFYYHMFGENVGSLNVYKRKVISGPLELLWSRRGNLGDFYERADIVLANSADYDIFQIIVEATVGDGNQGDIAIDDISFTDSCQLRNDTQLPEVTTQPPASQMTTLLPCRGGDFVCKNGFCVGLDMRCDGTPDCLDGSDEDYCGGCNFESDQCGWQVVPTGVYVWHRQLARDAPSSIAPATDHTTLGPNGYYMYVDQSQGTFGLAAFLQSPQILGDTGTRLLTTMATGQYDTVDPGQYYSSCIDIMTREAGRYDSSIIHGKCDTIRFEATPGGGFGDPDTVADIAIDDIAFINCGVSSDISCDFGPADAKTLCGWEQDTNDVLNWKLRSGGTPTYFTGPKGDHTTEGPGPEDYGTEAYIYFEVSNGKTGDNCRLLSGSIKPTGDQEYCFSFWYHMYGSTIGELNVYIRSTEGTDVLFHKRGTQEFKWLQGYRTIKTSNSFEIIMEGVRGKGYEGDIALDDLSYDPVPCPPPVECEFESDFCEWYNVDDDTPGFDWQRGMNGDPNLGTGPPVDHSSESTTAYFAFANVANMPELSEARLASPPFDRAGIQCLTFFYNIYGDDIGSLFVYKQDEGDNFVSPSWQKSGDQGQYWRQAQVEISPTTGKTFQVYFEAIAGSSTSGYMALDDITILPGVCPVTDFCTFEQNLCTWTNDFTNDDFDWIRDGAGTGSGGTGPDVDHTLNSARGYYMLIEANNKSPGDKAWFVSDRIPPTAGRCFDFWYHMYGSAVDTLNLYQQNVNSINPSLIWTKTGNLGNVWLNAKVTLQETNEFWVFLEGIVGKNVTADIAIDDLYIQDLPCSTTPAPPTTTTLPPTYAPDSHDCNFEQGLCLWHQDKSDDMEWTRKSGSTSSVDTGPSYDHTLGTSAGYYIFLETSSGLLDDYARLISSSLSSDNTTQYCLEFYYHMYGADINALSVYINQGADQLIWTKTQNQGDFWLQALVNIPLTGTYQVIFEATRGKSYKGDIAVDDIRFYLGSCPPSALCDLEFDECGYIQSPTNDFSWSRIRAGDSQTDLKKDHSYQTSGGHYMYADFNGQPSNAKAAIISPDFNPTSGSCLNFFFAPVGDLDAGTLSVRRRSPSGAELEVWSTLIGRLHQWHLAQATVSSAQPGEKYSVIFEANRDIGTTNGGVAIDDIETQSGICPVTAADCDFESGDTCGWQQVDEPDDDFDWTVISGSTASSGTGPTKDHTLNSKDGHYAFIESSSPNLAGDFAQLLSPIFSGYYNRCLEFYYHMFGDDSGTFNVYRRVEDLSMINVFTQSNNKGDVWRKGQVTMDDTVAVYDIIIEATVGGFQGDIAIDDVRVFDGVCPGFTGYIAIDDVRVFDGVCPGAGFTGYIAIDDVRVFDGVCPDEGTPCEFYCGTGEDCISSIQICDFVSDCPDHKDEEACGYSCQFEDDLCGWTSEYTGSFRWLRSRGELPVDNTGPYIDHTTLSPLGYYMYVAPYSGSLSWASLTSPKVHNTATSCEMQFWALLSGVNVGYIDVIVINDFSSWTALKIDDETGENVWRQQVVYIGRQRGTVQFAIRSSRSFAVQGAIAIDDIVFVSCDLPQPSAPCSVDDFQCANQVCISSNQACDYNDDCGDFSEEDDEDCAMYTRCNFEDGMCDYINIADDDDMDWQLGTGTQTNPLPPFDHTLLRPGGSFVYVGNAAANANKARLAGPVFQGGLGKYCRMRLWFYNYGSSPGYLQIAYRTGTTGPDQVLATVDGPIGNYWERYELVINSAFDFQPMIIAVQNVGARSGVIAVDDITYTDSCVKSLGTLPVNPPDGGTTVSPCGAGRWRCGDGGCIDRTQLCDYTADCGDASDEAKCGQCDFETDTCGYMDKSLGSIAWTRTSVMQSQMGAMDAGGYFMSVVAGTGVFDEPAILESVVLPPTSAKCVLQFWFQFQDSDDQATFNVFLVDDDNPDNKALIWYPFGTNNFWKQETIGLGRQTRDFTIRFEALLSDEDDVILLDDITMSDCAASSYDPCELQCINGFCIPQSMECDFSDDCGDRTDEKTCGKSKNIFALFLPYSSKSFVNL